MIITLDSDHFIEKNPLFPCQFFQKKRRFEAIIGVGSNIAHEKRRLQLLVHYLLKSKWVSLHSTSPLFYNPPFGYLEQRSFYNGAFLISTELFPKQLLKILLQIEKHFGRIRSFENAPRKLDLDIIFFENFKMQNQKLTLPHRGYYQRASVLVPLALLQI